MAEMTTLLAALYRKYTTTEQEKQKGVSPGISSRFELFYDDTFDNFKVSGTYSSTSILYIVLN